MDTSKIITVNGVKTWISDQGEGTPVVMLHGWAATAACWHLTADDFCADHRVIVPDLPGHGRSEGGAHRYGLRFYVNWLRDLLDTLGIDRAILLGNSLGGAITLAFTLEHPDRVLSLIPIDALGISGMLPYRTVQYVAKRLPYLIGIVLNFRMPSPLLSYLNGMVFLDPYAQQDCIIEMASLNAKHGIWYLWSGLSVLLGDFLFPRHRRRFTERLAAITTPTLIIWGRHDHLLPVRDAFAGTRHIPHARVLIFENSAHLPFMEEADDFNAILRAFLDSVTL